MKMLSKTFATRRGSGGTAMPGTGAFRLSPAFLPGIARLARRAARLPGLLLPFAERRAAPAGMRAPASLAAALAAGLALTLAATPAEAQTSGKLVSNTGQTHGGTHVGSDADRAQAFTTGSIAGGYKLTAVKVDTAAGALASGATFGLYATNGSGHPTGSSLGTFTNPAGSAAGLRTFTAPSGGIDLDAGTTYAFVMDLTQVCQTCVAFKVTEPDAEDAGAGSGWAIANNTLDRLVGGTSWTASGTTSLMIEIHGYAKVSPLRAPTVSAVPLQPDRLAVRWSAPGALTATDYDLRYYRGSADPANEADWIEADETGGHDHSGTLTAATITGLDPVSTYRVQVRATTEGTGPWSASGSGRTEALVGAWGTSVSELVGNTGKTVGGVNHLQHADVAQGFTTAGHSLGYTVTDVDLHFGTEAVGVQVRLATGVSTTSAGTTVATLRNPAVLTNGVLTFTAPPGTTLDANTTYYVVVEGTSGGLSWTTFSGFPSGLRDWSIDDRFTRTSGGWGSVLGKTLIRINGRAKAGDPPGKPGAPTLAAVSGSTSVTASWSAPTHTGSGITDYDVRYYEGSADPEDEADWIEEDETTGLPDRFTADASTSVTITGLKPSTAYRVQLRAESHGAQGPWSDSASVTTNAPTGTNNAPTRAKLAAVAANGCIADTGNAARGSFTHFAGTLQTFSGLLTTDNCVTGSPDRDAPAFIDADGDTLRLTAVAVIPDNVRFINGTPILSAQHDAFFVTAFAAGSATDVRINLTATDPHGATAEGWVQVTVPPISNTEVPRFDEMVGTRGFRRGAPIPRWVLPPANGGDAPSQNTAGQLPYFYAVSGLPPGLSFDPMTRTITGTPTQDGTYTVTYTADDADDKYSLKDSPDAADLADVARQSFVVQVGAPSIELVRIVSAPTYNSGVGNGFDTYIAGDEILVDVQFTEAVQVTGTPANPSARTRVILDVNGNNKFANLLEDGGVLYGGRRLRFGYTVAAADSDTDGVFVKPKNSNNVVLLVPTGLHVTGVKSGAAVVTTFEGLPTEGAANAKVDGSKSSADIGPRPVSAATDFAGDTLTVTFSRALNTQVDLSGTPLEAYFSIQGAGIVGAGRRGTYQHPNSITVSGKTLVMELGTPAQPGDTVTLSYENIGGGAWPLKDQSSTPRRVAGFVDLAVTSNVGVVAAPTVSNLVGNLGQSNKSTAGLSLNSVAQGFTTGSNADGYALDSVVLDFASAPSGGATVRLATGLSTTSGGTTFATLTSPATLAASENRFTAPAGTTLSADTQYFVVVQSANATGTVRTTGMAAEDAGGGAGWSIADEFSTRNKASNGGFITVVTSSSVKMRIDGAAKLSDLARRGAGTLVGNLGQSNKSTAGLSLNSVAQGFTTGSNADGYALDSVVLDFASAPSGGATVRLATGLSTTSGGTTFATLTSPATLAASENRFTAPAGTTLSADTQYFVVVQSANATGTVRTTGMAAEDAGGGAGWSIADEFSTRNKASNGGFITVVTSSSVKMRVDGYEISTAPPVAARASAVGTALELVFDQRLDQDSRPPGNAFTVRAVDVDDSVRTIAGAGSAVVIDDATVTVTLTAAVKEGELLSVSYAKPAESPLRAAAGSPDVLPFEGFHVEGVHDSTPPKLVGVVYVDHPTLNGFMNWTLYFDEALDTGSAPAAADFELRQTSDTGTKLTPQSFAVTNNAVTFNAGGVAPTMWLKYTPPATGGIRDLAGNPAAKIDGTTYSKLTAGKPKPVATHIRVDGTLLSVDMTSTLDPTFVPDASAFTLHYADTDSTAYPTSVEAVRLEFRTVQLPLAGSVHPCAGQTPIRVKYTKPTGASDAKLQGLAGAETDTFGPWNVRNERHSQCVTRSVSGGRSGSQVPVWEQKSVTLKFGRALDRTKTLDPADFTVEVPGASGSSAPSVRGASHTADGTGVTLALSRARNAGETATVGYTWPRSGQGLWDTAGNQIDSFSGVEVRGDEEPEAAPLTASFHGLPDAHDGFGAFGFELHFSEEVKLSHRSLRDGSALQVANGRVTKAKRLAKGENRRWAITVQPDEPRWTGRGSSPFRAVTVALAAASDCAAAGAVCTHGGKKLSAAVSATVPGPGSAAPLPVLAVADASADEGGTLAFAVTLDKAATGEVTVDYATADGTATAGADYAATSGTLTFAAGETAKTVQVTALSDTTAEDDETLTLTLSNASGATIGTASATGTVANVTPPLTASFHGVPAEHDGKRLFAFEVRFSEEFQGLRLTAFKAGALQVTGGRIVDAKRTARGENRSVTVRVRPSSYDDMVLTLPATTDCTAASAICAIDGRKLSETVTATVQGPALLSVADAEVQEGAGAALEFRVTLSRAASGEVTVDYATRDGTATAGADYTATRGTLTFAAGETAKTVSVPVLDDSEDEGRETLALKLMNASGAAILDGEATGTIVNSDAIPRGWLARFGRTVAETHVDAVRDRLGANRSPGFSATFAGQPVPGPGAGQELTQAAADGTGIGPESAMDSSIASLASPGENAVAAMRFPAVRDLDTGRAGTLSGLPEDAEDGILSLRSFLAGEDEGEPEARALTGDDVLLGTSFATMRDTGTGSSLGFWGRASRSGFSGLDDGTSVDGEVTGVMLGTDWKRKGTIFGMVLSQSRGTGTYSGATSGEIDVTLTGLVPWAGREIGESLSVWGAAGIGRGDMTVTPEGADPIGTGIGWSMAAAGADGTLAAGERFLGAGLRWHADALRTRTSSDAATGLAATTGATTRLRIGVTADWRRTLESGATLGPRLEAGLRHDGGDAETGFGLEIGGGLGFSDPASGLSMTFDGRTLALHEDGAFGNWGLSLGLSWDPAPETKRGWSLAARQSRGGASAGGVDALLGPEAFPGLAGTEIEGSWSLEAAYGTGRGNGMVGSPYGRASGTDGVDGLRLGYRIEPDADHAADASLDFWAQPGAGGTGREAGAGLQWRW